MAPLCDSSRSSTSSLRRASRVVALWRVLEATIAPPCALHWVVTPGRKLFVVHREGEGDILVLITVCQDVRRHFFFFCFCISLREHSYDLMMEGKTCWWRKRCNKLFFFAVFRRRKDKWKMTYAHWTGDRIHKAFSLEVLRQWPATFTNKVCSIRIGWYLLLRTHLAWERFVNMTHAGWIRRPNVYT